MCADFLSLSIADSSTLIFQDLEGVYVMTGDVELVFGSWFMGSGVLHVEGETNI